MVRTFFVGILLGAALAAAAAYLVPAVDQRREASLITVQPNGGNREAFHVELPGDRILAGGNGVAAALPGSLEWPAADVLTASRAELFKLRNERGAVIGVASRISGPAPGAVDVVEWTLHLPARGTLFVSLQPEADGAGTRAGTLHAGTREFARLEGTAEERLVVTAGAGDAGDAEGRIELVTARRGAPGSGQ